MSVKIAFYTIGEDTLPSTRFRVLQYLPSLKDAEMDVSYFCLPKTTGGKLMQFIGSLIQGIIRWRQLGKAAQYDIIVVQKGLTPWRCRGLAKRLIACKPYIMDIDDAVYAMTPVRFPSYLRWLQMEDEPIELLKQAKHIIAGNKFLANFVSKYNKNVTVIPTPIDTRIYTVPRKEAGKKLVIGWSGSSATNFYLNELIPVFKSLAKRYDFAILIISNSLKNIRIEDLAEIKTEFIEWSKETEVADLQKIDIGVMPLKDDEWSRGKCGLKALQYMALGIPAVCSPVGVNAEIIQDGKNGFLAVTKDEWEVKLGALIKNEALRKDIGMQARKTVEERYSVAANAPKLINILSGRSE